MRKFKLPELWHVAAWIILFIAYPRATSVAFIVLMVCLIGSWLHRKLPRESKGKSLPF